MSEFVTPAILHQQMSAYEIRQTRTLLEVIVPGHWATWSKFGPSEEITDLLKWSTVLQSQAHQAGDYVVETDQFRRAVGPFEAKKYFCGVFVVMGAEVEGTLAGDSDFLCDVRAAVGEGKAGAHAATTSRSILKLRGRSVVCWVPLGTPAKR